MRGRFPPWLHHPLPSLKLVELTEQAVQKGILKTVCQEARCPNIAECYSKKTATFLALGSRCTRRCGFCSIDFSKNPEPPDPEEPRQIVEAVQALGLRHVVITQVARDDLLDGGANALSLIVEAIRKALPRVTIELLTSDFAGNLDSLEKILASAPEVINHNIETVLRLTPRVRHVATYERSLFFLKEASERKTRQTHFIKSGLMVGLGESDQEVYETLLDLARSGVNSVTIGQYLQSSRKGLLVKRFVPPETFTTYARWGKELGIAHMHCAPFMRSSYNAQELLETSAENFKNQYSERKKA